MKDPCGGRDEFGRCAVTPLTYIPVHSGVQLVGERGALGSRPVLHAVYKAESYPLFVINGNDVRVEGLHFRGPSGSTEVDQEKVGALQVIEDPVMQLGRRVVIADNEFEQWPDYGVNVAGKPGEPRIRPADAGLVRIERNYFHHNARDKAGYGIVVGGNAYATIEGNVFDFNRHDVTSDGGENFNGYIARFNYALQGGFTYEPTWYYDGYWGQHFDVHGFGTAESRANSHYDGGQAGEFFEIAFNTIRGAQTYGGFAGIGERTRAAFELRGRPTQGARFNYNVLVHNGLSEAVRLKRGDDATLDEDRPGSFSLQADGNLYAADFSAELATGDFDGDGRTDVFVANGTAWFFSRAGIRPWEFLHASTKRTKELGFADIDNDGVTDVLYRDPNGNLGYLKSGTHDLVPLTTVAVPMKELRFGDFDGDGLTDIFYTQGGQWYIWYGRTRTWTPTQSSSCPLSELLFGEFDDVRGTDVAAVVNGVWSFSSGGVMEWAKLNNRLTDSFANAVAADFDGDGKTDIAFNDDAFVNGATWRYSRGGRSPLALLRDREVVSRNGAVPIYSNVPLKELLIGAFDGGGRAMVVTFEHMPWLPPVVGERLVIWRGLGSDNAFSTRSLQNMR